MNLSTEKHVRPWAELCDRALPTFLIVGAAKCGTTSLYEYIRQHPEAYMPSFKEPHYFANGVGVDLDTYLQLFEPGRDKKARGEASTGYLYPPETPRWIQEVLGNVKIVVLLRDPAARAFSLYNWMVMAGYEPCKSFEEALNLEAERGTSVNPPSRHSNVPDYLYHATGLYFEQVKRYIATFGRDHVGVWLFEDLTETPGQVCSEVFHFLGIDATFRPRFDVHNASRRPLSGQFQFWLRNRLPGRFPESWIRYGMQLNTFLGHRPRRPEELTRRLRVAYREDVQRLQDLLGRDLSHWIN